MKNLDEKDKRILEMLLEDSRRPYHEIATDSKVNLSESTVRKRVIKLQEGGIIEKFTIKLCREDERCIYAFLTLIPKNESEIKDLLRETVILPQCEEVYKLDGRCGILIKVNVPDTNELDAILEMFHSRTDIESVERVCIVLKPIKTISQT
ncbi:MAG: Lrp/AsnC family transcriptional regulator [Candidatus Lokiarchaeota archaeon]|nr:Lrp/AsnC family transcriptional regulator [Candidatus Lokiarchaeota archaeon]MCK4382546.1 Lrp/AsnC family transcriptional regulator [Candidatus Lokiarchaeota archaeon]